MPEVKIRKQVRILEEIFHEGGPAAATRASAAPS